MFSWLEPFWLFVTKLFPGARESEKSKEIAQKDAEKAELEKQVANKEAELLKIKAGKSDFY